MADERNGAQAEAPNPGTKAALERENADLRERLAVAERQQAPAPDAGAEARAEAQRVAEEKAAELEKRLAAAEEREKAAAAKVEALEGDLAAVRASAPEPMAAGGTITVNAKGEVVR